MLAGEPPRPDKSLLPADSPRVGEPPRPDESLLPDDSPRADAPLPDEPWLPDERSLPDESRPPDESRLPDESLLPDESRPAAASALGELRDLLAEDVAERSFLAQPEPL